MRYRLVLFACALAPCPARAQVDQDAQAWLTLNATGAIGGPVLANVETVGRLSDTQARIYEAEFTGQIGYRISKVLTVWAGYTRVPQYRRDASPNIENRAREQVSATWDSVGGGTLSSRTLLEQRFRRDEGGTGWRLREQIRYVRPIGTGGRVSAVLWHESFIGLTSTRWGQQAGYERMRDFIGIGLPVTKTVRAELGYLNQLDINRDATDQMAHAASATFSYAF